MRAPEYKCGIKDSFVLALTTTISDTMDSYAKYISFGIKLFFKFLKQNAVDFCNYFSYWKNKIIPQEHKFSSLFL